MLGLARSTTELMMIVAAAWLATGLTLAVVMGRRGHGSFQWFLIGAALGLLALPIAWTAIRDEGRRSPVSLAESGSGGGPVNVLVGIDGSAEAALALRTAIELIGDHIGHLTLANVVTFDEASRTARREEERAAELLEATATSLNTMAAGQIVLIGQPADALMNHATEEGYDLLVIGRRGRGASKTLLGSTASRAANGPIPVLIV